MAQSLAAAGNRLILHGRDPDRLSQTAAEIQAETGAVAPETVLADLAELRQVRQLSEQVAALTDRLDVFVSNAGVGSGYPAKREREVSADGYELRFAVNYLAGFDLALRLLPLLQAAGSARIVNVASLGTGADRLRRRDDRARLQRFPRVRAEQARTDHSGLHDGRAPRPRRRDGQQPAPRDHDADEDGGRRVRAHVSTPWRSGEEATRRLVDDPALAGVTGRFYDRLREARVHESSYDPQVRAKLWQVSLELTGAPDLPV